MKSTQLFLITLFVLSFISCSPAYDGTERGRLAQQKFDRDVRDDIVERIELSTKALETFRLKADAAVAKHLLKTADCVAVLPNVVQAAFVVGGRFGRGVVSCRTTAGDWTAPAFLRFTGGSVGFQLGAESTDLFLFFTGEAAKAALLADNLTLGADATVAVGPVGRSVAGREDLTDTGIYTYASSKGLFGGVSLEGGVLQPDENTNKRYYGQAYTMRDILVSEIVAEAPKEARAFTEALN